MARANSKKKNQKAKKGSQLLKGSSPVFGGINVSSLSSLEPILDPENWDMLQIITVANLIIVGILMQIRSYNLGCPIGELDQLSSVKSYKGILAMSGKPLAAALVIFDTAAFIPDNATKQSVYNEICEFADRMTGNCKVLERVTEQNLSQYRFGLCSRILGQLQSCPMTNPELIGFSQQKVQDLSIADLCKAVGFGDPEKAKAQVLSLINSHGTVFNEPLLATGPTLGGYTKLEKEVFGDNVIRTQPIDAKTSVGFGGMIQPNSINNAANVDVLNAWERARYSSAQKSGNVKVLTEINKLIQARINSNVKTTTKASKNSEAITPNSSPAATTDESEAITPDTNSAAAKTEPSSLMTVVQQFLGSKQKSTPKKAATPTEVITPKTSPTTAKLGLEAIAKKLSKNAKKELFVEEIKRMHPNLELEKAPKGKLVALYYALLADNDLPSEKIDELLS